MALPDRPAVVCVSGASGSGKTILVAGMVKELSRRGYRVATVKHAAHGFQLDEAGKDSWRHAAAGAVAVAVSGPSQFALLETPAAEYSLRSVLARLPPVDVVLVEGYKGEACPRIQILPSNAAIPVPADPHVIAFVVADPQALPPAAAGAAVPVLSRDDIAGLCSLVARLVPSGGLTSGQREKARGEMDQA